MDLGIPGWPVPQRDRRHHLQSQVLPDRRLRCPQVLHGIGPPPPSRKVPLFASRREGREVQEEESQNDHQLVSLHLSCRVWENTLARLFTRYLSECKVPSQWKTSKTVLLYKKRDVHNIGYYRPICLLSVVYKLFTRVILNRISRTLDEGQPREQA
ncbi:unnamed protein product [Heligmosomoides polygyrus]|uniref:Reverse transcriptase domain-containing protein n=1 Tax=Heligmosomoides polygyrus TaxID=6339 RepID=A0A183GM72_HELPZ|nr:unnamed protein product [Heligmosomoides polygyrus]